MGSYAIVYLNQFMYNLKLFGIIASFMLSLSSFGQSRHGKSSRFPSYKGLVMAGYQGWFNAPEDGAERGWNHYNARGTFGPGNCKIDCWPDVSEYPKTYKTPFITADSSAAYLFSSYDASTVNLHFSWMKQYGVDGVFMQRFIGSVRGGKNLRHSDKVMSDALQASEKYQRAIAVMYDLSGMKDNDTDPNVVINDWKHLLDDMKLTSGSKHQTYLYHNGKPLVAVWGVGFSDGRAYGIKGVEKIVDFLKNDPVYGGCAVLLGVPTYWRDFGRDTDKDPQLHDLLRKADIIQPWMVGRYNEASYPNFKDRIRDDIAWCKQNKLDYVPVVFPGFSWHNMNPKSPANQIPRNRGKFYWAQIAGAIQAGSEMLYVAMFDEIDEGTAIFKLSKNPPVGLSNFVTPEPDIPADFYLYLTGKAGKMLRKEIEFTDSQLKYFDSTLPKYLDPALPIEERIDDLLPRMTLSDKIIQLSDNWGSKGIPRLKIPAMLKTEGLHGQSYSTGATIFPQPIAMASTFDTTLIGEVGHVTAVEAKAANLRCSWSPVLDVARDARWGRVEETYGEDPYLVSRMGVAWIKGFQSEHMIAIPKHFAGHGEPLGGRDSHDVGLSDRVMRNIHLVPFRAAIEEAHAGGVMAAYSTWNGVPDNASMALLQKILREEWDFDGIVVSDCGGPENLLTKQSVVNNLEEASRLAILAGVDIECGNVYAQSIAMAVRNGTLSESDLAPNVRRVLRTKFKLGLFENPGPPDMVWDKLPVYDGPEHRAIARQVAVEGAVLLKNDHQLLPLRKDLGMIAVIGPNADMAQTGDYSAKPAPGQLVTVLQGIRSHISANTHVLFAKGCGVQSADTSGFLAAIEAAKKADVVVMVMGDFSTREYNDGQLKESATTGENVDGATLEIPGMQRRLIKAISAIGKPVVLVLVNGKPFTLSWEAENIPAILETWYPGEEGGNATADLLFGDRNPSGRLPITFPRHAGQLPLHYDYEPSGRRYNYYDMPFTPLYRFGYGLSYTQFNYSNLTVSQQPDNPGFVTVSADIENIGDRDGDDVAQLYVTDLVTPVITPVIALKGIRRISLKKGEKATVSFLLTPYQLSQLNADMARVLEPGKFRIHVGGASPEPPEGTDNHKQKIGFKDPSQGISGEFSIKTKYQADFTMDIKAPGQVQGGQPFPVTLTIKNQGNLTDMITAKLYGEELIGDHHFEIAPGETRSFTFTAVLFRSGPRHLTLIAGTKILSTDIIVSKAPARLVLSRAETVIGDDGILHYRSLATNAGSEPYTGRVAVNIDGKDVAGLALQLDPGVQRDIALDYRFPYAGIFKVQVPDNDPQQMTVPGSIGLSLQDPLFYASFDQAALNPGSTANKKSIRNEIDGSLLQVQGIPRFSPGRNGNGFGTDDPGTYIRTGVMDLYRKPFTLAAWVLVESSENGQAAFFGGQAPMGADVDNTGTSLSAGLRNGQLSLSFLDRDIHGSEKVPVGKWVHIAYTYNPMDEKGSVFLNGKLDKTMSQRPYTGPLEMIGNAPRSGHGKFIMDEVLVARSCLWPQAISELMQHGPEALRKGEITTEWRSVSTMPAALQTRTVIPPGSTIRVIVEAAGADEKITDSLVIDLQSGTHSYPLAGFHGNGQLRLRVLIAATDWKASPVLLAATLMGDGSPLQWSMTADWSKSRVSGGIKIGW